MQETKSWINKNWQIIVAVCLVVFNVGYTVARIESKPDRDEVTNQIIKAIDAHKQESKENYIEIKKVPGLQESLGNIDDRLKDLQNRFDKMEENFYKK